MIAGAEIGVVLSGGGANGAYEVGVLKALLHGRSPSTGYRAVDPAIYTGTSVGAYNAAIMASRPGTPATATVDELEALWLDRLANTVEQCGNGVFRVRGAPFQLLSPGCLARPLRSLLTFCEDAADLALFGLAKGAQFALSEAPLPSRLVGLIDLEAFVSESPFRSLIDESIDLDLLRQSEKSLTIAATNWELGRLRLFSKGEITGAMGAACILASSALPGIFPPVPLEGVPYVDGGVLLNSPLGPAIASGATTIHVVFLDPLIRNITLAPLASSVDTFYRLFAIIWAAHVRRDLLAAAAINELLELLARGDLEAAELGSDAARGWVRLGRWLLLGHHGASPPYRPLTIHIYRPASALGSGEGVLDFHRRRLAALVELGYEDAVHHDCEAAGCLRPGRRPGGERATVERRAAEAG